MRPKQKRRTGSLSWEAVRRLQAQARDVSRIIASRGRSFLEKRYQRAVAAAGTPEPEPAPRPKLRPLPVIDRPVKCNRHNEKLMARNAFGASVTLLSSVVRL
jgi:hypothetical protein